MKKATMMKKGAAFTLAAMMACTVYAPTAVFATGLPEGQEAPVVEQPIETAAPQAEVNQAAPQTEVKEAPVVENQEAEAVEGQAPAAEEPAYGEATGNWGYGNSTQTTRWDEYTKDGETILVFRSTGESDEDADNAVTQLLDENGKSVKEDLKKRVTQVVFETGITGIGWTALYDRGSYEPVYGSEYEVNRDKTDLFKDFTKLTVVTPCETIKRIGWSAFRKCSNLREFDFSKCTQLEEIMNQAFNECKALNNVDLSNCNALRSIAWSAFNGAGKGKDASLTLPTDGVLAVIGGYAFYKFAEKNSAGAEVDFAAVAGSVTQVLQKAFEGSHILGTITGFKNLDGIGKDAVKNSYVTYVQYVPSQEAEEEPPIQEEELPAVQETEEPAPQNDVMPVIDDVVTPVIQEVVAEAMQIEIASVVMSAPAAPAEAAEEATATAEATEETMAIATADAKAETSKEAAASNGATGRAAINDSAAPAAAPAVAEISDNDAPQAVAQAEDSLVIPGYIPGAFALASLLSLIAAIALMRKSYKSRG